jgi:hypothetical protein
VTPEGTQGSVAIFVLIALAVSILIGALMRQLWAQSEKRTIERMWQKRERQLDSRKPVVPAHEEIFEWTPRAVGNREVVQAQTAARLLYIVSREQPGLFAFLRQDFAAEESEGVIQILMNRRQRMQPCGADGRDARRNWEVSVGLREIGFALVRQQEPLHFDPPKRIRRHHEPQESMVPSQFVENRATLLMKAR